MESDVSMLKFSAFTEDDLEPAAYYFNLRPNKSCESTPVDAFIWRQVWQTEKAFCKDHCMFMIATMEDLFYASMPHCSETDLPECFLLQERYFNEILKAKHRLSYADSEGTEVLRRAGLLDNYEVIPDTGFEDYIYNAGKLRTLSGRHLAKKRNHIHHFEEMYAGRWYYRTLSVEDRKAVLDLFDRWKDHKKLPEEQIDTDSSGLHHLCSELEHEYQFIKKAFSDERVLRAIRAGGIFIDGILRAVSIGSYNEFEKMAIIHIEKADADFDGLYQMINREFLVHAFPEAQLVNREDDAGDEGLRSSKQSYYPDDRALRWVLIQKNFD